MNHASSFTFRAYMKEFSKHLNIEFEFWSRSWDGISRWIILALLKWVVMRIESFEEQCPLNVWFHIENFVTVHWLEKDWRESERAGKLMTSNLWCIIQTLKATREAWGSSDGASEHLTFLRFIWFCVCLMRTICMTLSRNIARKKIPCGMEKEGLITCFSKMLHLCGKSFDRIDEEIPFLRNWKQSCFLFYPQNIGYLRLCRMFMKSTIKSEVAHKNELGRWKGQLYVFWKFENFVLL